MSSRWPVEEGRQEVRRHGDMPRNTVMSAAAVCSGSGQRSELADVVTLDMEVSAMSEVTKITVSKRHGVGSSESIGFDLLTAQCLRSSAADLSSGPEPGIHSGFSNKMINNNNPLREREGAAVAGEGERQRRREAE
ncbi:hypothetical protein GBF38_017466 [Nibea albiflora]|uniref:Uncharacterized protein n=1 Tax=Nibea albiflora TaxID=240163 RepID=A0ACB7F589_NIBAL|nr:hypothetical protein GBF38_017466 [Nibea albiflora]